MGTSQVQTACWQSFMVAVGVSCVNCNEDESVALSYRWIRRIESSLAGRLGGWRRHPPIIHRTVVEGRFRSVPVGSNQRVCRLVENAHRRRESGDWGISQGEKDWSWREESNLQPVVYKTTALPLSYASKSMIYKAFSIY